MIMGLIKNEWLIPLGSICLALAIGIDRFLVGNGILDFTVGVLIGLSMVLNLTGLYRTGRNNS